MDPDHLHPQLPQSLLTTSRTQVDVLHNWFNDNFRLYFSPELMDFGEVLESRYSAPIM